LVRERERERERERDTSVMLYSKWTLKSKNPEIGHNARNFFRDLPDFSRHTAGKMAQTSLLSLQFALT